MQPCKTGDQLYSDASPYSECSLDRCLFDEPKLSIAYFVLIRSFAGSSLERKKSFSQK